MFVDVRIVNLSWESHTFRSTSFQLQKLFTGVEVAKIFLCPCRLNSNKMYQDVLTIEQNYYFLTYIWARKGKCKVRSKSTTRDSEMMKTLVLFASVICIINAFTLQKVSSLIFMNKSAKDDEEHHFVVRVYGRDIFDKKGKKLIFRGKMTMMIHLMEDWR